MADQFVPSSPEPLDPDNALASLEADFEERVDPPELLVVEEEPPPIGRSWAFDFVSGRFQSGATGKAPLATNGVATLIVWAEKCLRTVAGAHPIHPPGYGVRERSAVLGRAVAGAPVGELEQRIREALTFHPRIVDIEDFEFDFDPLDEWVNVTFSLVLDDDTVVPLNDLAMSVASEF